MSDRTRTLRLNAQEEERLQTRAREAGLYEHGFIKAVLRIALGLPVSQQVRSEVTRTETLTRR